MYIVVIKSSSTGIFLMGLNLTPVLVRERERDKASEGIRYAYNDKPRDLSWQVGQ